MTFKIGDKVKITANRWGHLGQIMTIKRLPTPSTKYYVLIHPKTGHWTYEEHNLQAIKKPKHQVFNI